MCPTTTRTRRHPAKGSHSPNSMLRTWMALHPPTHPPPQIPLGLISSELATFHLVNAFINHRPLIEAPTLATLPLSKLGPLHRTFLSSWTVVPPTSGLVRKDAKPPNLDPLNPDPPKLVPSNLIPPNLDLLNLTAVCVWVRPIVI